MDDQQHECGICKRVFTSASQFLIHQLGNEDEKVHSCSVCGWKYGYEQNLVQHLDDHRRKYKVDEIEKMKIASQCNHAKTVDNLELQSDSTEEEFGKQDSLLIEDENRPTRGKKEDHIFLCKASNGIVPNCETHGNVGGSEMKTHEQSERKSEASRRNFTCIQVVVGYKDGAMQDIMEENCSQESASNIPPELLTIHGKVMENQVELTKCGDHLPVQVSLSCKRVSSGEKPYQCKICMRKFLHFDGLETHIMGVHEKKRPFTCQFCQRNFPRISSLKMHEKTHTGEKPHQCEFCGKGFLYSHNMHLHRRRVHEGIRPFVCETCAKTFTSLPCLKRHEKIHTGEKPFKCSLCGKQFILRETLNGHISRIHDKNRPFNCQVCKKAFSSKSDLARHANLMHNSVDRPFKCDICEKEFKQLCYLGRHMRDIHKFEKPQTL